MYPPNNNLTYSKYKEENSKSAAVMFFFMEEIYTNLRNTN